MTREEWKAFFSGHWSFGGERQTLHEAMFPDELPCRLIRMFSFVGETVLDPFLGSGTTVKVALDLGRKAIGYEIQPASSRSSARSWAFMRRRCSRPQCGSSGGSRNSRRSIRLRITSPV
jgi:DNA modification methylase